MAAKDDRMISCSHGQKIYDVFPGKKKINIF